MRRDFVEWKIEEIYEKRNQIDFPDYQRSPKLWKVEDKRLLIDSILIDMDIPKFYLNKKSKDEYEVVDGQQRLWAIWQFINNEYLYETKSKDSKLKVINKKHFKDFPEDIKENFLSYKIQITLFRNASEEYLRKLFVRLQLGLILVAGEKLKASTGKMKNFIFNEMVKHPFIESLNIKNIRFAKQTLCAQICINSFSREDQNKFSRTRYEDLQYFFEEYKNPVGSDLKFFDKQCKKIIDVLDVLAASFNSKNKAIKNRSLILTIYFFVEEMKKTLKKQSLNKELAEFVDFILLLFVRLNEEAAAGFYRKNEELYRFGSFLSNAPGEKYQINSRHNKLAELFKYYQKHKIIKGDK